MNYMTLKMVMFSSLQKHLKSTRNDFESAHHIIGNNQSFSEDSGFALNPWVMLNLKMIAKRI